MDNTVQRPISVAITDDHQLWHDQLNISLPELGFTIAANAFNGQELLDKLQAMSNLPDVCLLDISMPVMDGYETARQLKALYPNIRILAFSMDDDEQTVASIKQAGADGFLWKCCSMEELNKALLQVQQTT